jgi:hypothetical protein
VEGRLTLAPADIAVILDRLAELSGGLALLNTEVRSNRDEIRVIDGKLTKALYGGNGAASGIYERLRLLTRWKVDHGRTHDQQNVERRRKSDDLKGFMGDVVRDSAKVVVAALIAFAMFKATGQIPAGIFGN